MSKLKENRSHDVEGKNGVKYKRNPKGQWVVVDPGKDRRVSKRQIIKNSDLIKKLNDALVATHDVVDSNKTVYDLDAQTNKWRVVSPGPGVNLKRGEEIIDQKSIDLLNKLYDKSQYKKLSPGQKLSRLAFGDLAQDVRDDPEASFSKKAGATVGAGIGRLADRLTGRYRNAPDRDTQEIQTNSLKPVRLSTILFEQPRPKRRNMISESGSAPGVGKIHIDEIAPTLAPISKFLGIDLMKQTLGSVGKKQFSGDIDCAINIPPEEFNNLKEKLENSPLFLYVEKTSVYITKIKIQNYDPNRPYIDPKTKEELPPPEPRTGFVQLDLMPGDPDWLKTYYHSPSETESKYKGVYRNILLSSIAAVLDYDASAETTPDGRPLEARRFMWSSSDGLIRVLRKPVPKKKGDGYTKQNTNKIIDGPWKKPADIVKVLKLDDPADLNSYESLKAAIERNYPSDTVDKILSSFARNSVIQSMGVPDDLTESEDLWDPDNVIPCARCGEPIDFNPGGDEDCTNPNCAPTDDEYTRGGGVSQEMR